MVVGYSPGATYDIYTRNFARHLGNPLLDTAAWLPSLAPTSSGL